MAYYFGEKTRELLTAELIGLEEVFSADLLYYFGPIHYGLANDLKTVLEY